MPHQKDKVENFCVFFASINYLMFCEDRVSHDGRTLASLQNLKRSISYIRVTTESLPRHNQKTVTRQSSVAYMHSKALLSSQPGPKGKRKREPFYIPSYFCLIHILFNVCILCSPDTTLVMQWYHLYLCNWKFLFYNYLISIHGGSIFSLANGFFSQTTLYW